MKLFDSHAHYNDDKFSEDRDAILQEINRAGVTKLVNAGYSLESSIQALEIANAYDWMYVICGISPNDIPENKQGIEEQIAKLEKIICKDKCVRGTRVASIEKEELTVGESIVERSNQAVNKSDKVVAIGEIGLDYYWNKENKDLQQYAFVKQIELANRLELPIVIHSREAVSDTIDILKNQIVANKKGIFHCCPLNRELVKEAVGLGFYISFAGPVTFKNSKNADEIIKLVPLDRMLIETDSPYLSPEPNRGKRNDSRNVYYIAEKIAKVLDLSVDEVANQTYKNAELIFGIKE